MPSNDRRAVQKGTYASGFPEPTSIGNNREAVEVKLRMRNRLCWRSMGMHIVRMTVRMANSFMHRCLLALLLPSAAAFLLPQAPAQTVQSPYLLNPGLAIGYVDSCARFWFTAYDSVQGGFFMNIDRTGKLISSWGTGKNTLNQSRDAYGFLRAYMLTGKQEYLLYARRALDFLYSSGWDKSSGGWYNEIDRYGIPSNPSAEKTAYYQHYAMLGIAASVEVTDDSLDRAVLERSLVHTDAHFWDARPGVFGYFDRTRADGTQPLGKSFNATVDAVTTHLLSLYLMTEDTVYRRRLMDVADNMVNRLAASAGSQAIGFVEGYDTEWNPDPANTMTIMGHVLKTAWCLGRLYSLFHDQTYLAAAEQLVQSVLQKGYDHQNGGPYKDYNRITGAMLMWGQQDTAKAWWQMEQAVTAGLMLYSLTGNPAYLQMADETLTFFMTHFVDHVYGEVYENRTKVGGQIWDTNKGSSGKAAYHSVELGYYVYLYGNLLLKRSPATLYYAFPPVQYPRTITLAPIAADLRIASVLLNGLPFGGVDHSNCTLSIPPFIGGEFVVTFERPLTSAQESQLAQLPGMIHLDQNYPNPFNQSTVIGYQISKPGHVRIAVYDLLGRKVAVLVDEPKTVGRYSVHYDGAALASGVYLCRLEAAGAGLSRRMILTK